jgi:endoglucanase
MTQKTISIALLYFTLLSHFAYSQSLGNADKQLYVKGNQILNNKNEPAQLRGISFSWSIWQGKKYYNTKVVDWLQKDFKVSLVRLSMAIQPAGGYLDHPDAQIKLITTLADYAVAKGIYVIIDWHDHNAERHLEQSKHFFSMMAKRYSGEPHIIYEIWNEPEKQSWSTVKTYATEVIKTIRAHDKSNLIIVGSPHWDQDVDVVAKDPLVGFSNIAYSFHFYASDTSHQQKLRDRAQSAIDKGLPLFVTEWGVGEADGDGIFDKKKSDVWLKWMETNKLSWANWNITDKKETTALLKPKANREGNWKQDKLTPAGKYIRLVLRGLNK